MILRSVAVAVWTAFAACPVAGHAEHSQYSVVDGHALGGHDAVAYFSRHKSVPGRSEFALRWRGAIWLFESAESMSMFEMNPTAYAPQYGGYCAYAVAKGQLVPADPDVFTVTDGKLYLNASPDAHRLWSGDVAGHVAEADRNWPGLAPK